MDEEIGSLDRSLTQTKQLESDCLPIYEYKVIDCNTEREITNLTTVFAYLNNISSMIQSYRKQLNELRVGKIVNKILKSQSKKYVDLAVFKLRFFKAQVREHMEALMIEKEVAKCEQRE